MVQMGQNTKLSPLQGKILTFQNWIWKWMNQWLDLHAFIHSPVQSRSTRSRLLIGGPQRAIPPTSVHSSRVDPGLSPGAGLDHWNLGSYDQSRCPIGLSSKGSLLKLPSCHVGRPPSLVGNHTEKERPRNDVERTKEPAGGQTQGLQVWHTQSSLVLVPAQEGRFLRHSHLCRHRESRDKTLGDMGGWDGHKWLSSEDRLGRL